MNLNSKSVNVTKRNLIEHAVKLLVNGEIKSSTGQHASAALAQGFLQAAALMSSDEHIVYIDLGERPVYR